MYFIAIRAVMSLHAWGLVYIMTAWCLISPIQRHENKSECEDTGELGMLCVVDLKMML